MTIAEQITRAKTDYDEVYHAGKLAVLQSSEVLHGTASGETIAVRDVSLVEHKLGVEVRSKNLIPYPYEVTSKELNGITFIDNGDGSITVNGTATESAVFYLCTSRYIIKRGKTITLTGCPAGGNWGNYALYIQYRTTSNSTVFQILDIGKGDTITLPDDEGLIYSNLMLTVWSGVTVDNLTFYPQLELGTEATPYTPYISDFTGVEVSRYRKNLFDEAVLDVTNWAIEDTVRYVYSLYIPNGTYTISGSFDTTNDNYLYLQVSYDNGITWDDYHYIVANKTVYTATFTVSDNTIYRLWAGFKRSVEDINKLQLELGSTATEYEPYIEPQTVTANADGTVDGLTSISPSMTLVSDTEGVIITAEYIKDIDKAFEERIAALESAIVNNE